jgi:SH3 domain protein
MYCGKAMKRNRIKGLGVGFAVALALTPIAGASTQTGLINGANINLRKKDSTSAEVVTTLAQGTQVNIVAENNGWYQVKTEDCEGYVRTDKVNVVAAGKTLYCAKDQINLREKPDTLSSIITVLKVDTKVSVKEVSGEWYHITTEGKEGYIRADLLADKASIESVAEIDESTDAKTKKADNTDMIDDGFDENEESLDTYFEEVIKKEASAQANDKEMQQILKDLGFFSGEPDGKFGSVSQAALRAFQRSYDLQVDGEVGDETIEAARQAVAAGGNGSSAGKVLVSENGVILSEWFNHMKDYFPKYVPLRCVDVESGEEFYLRAFSCGNHADVEPPTQAETEKLKAINGGKWSWTPRPIWVYIDGQAYAAVINVMPHGPDTLPNNGMSGQICMHFLHSRNHNTGRENADMQAGILKAFEHASQAPAPKLGDTLIPEGTLPEGLPTE